ARLDGVVAQAFGALHCSSRPRSAIFQRAHSQARLTDWSHASSRLGSTSCSKIAVMVNKPLARARLITQGVAASLQIAADTGSPAHAQEIAAYFGASHGQDFPGAIAALAYRMGTATAVDAVRQAFEQGLLVRGYPMRGTVFVTAAEDLAWITELCSGGPARSAQTNRPRLGLDDAHIDQAAQVLHDIAVDDGTTRTELFASFE